MTPAAYRAAFIRELDRMDPTGLIPPFVRAHLIAKTMQEVPSWDGQGISTLATAYNNLFGINAREDEPGVTLDGNPIDKEQGREKVHYRVYASWEDSIRDCLTHLFSSGHYMPAYLKFLGAAEHVWATNPAHAGEVSAKFIVEASEMTDSAKRRGLYAAAYGEWLGRGGRKPEEGGIA